MKIVVDTSSLLSIGFMEVLDETLDIAEVCITNIVLKELKEIAGFNDEKADIAKRILKLVKSKKVECFHIKNESFSKYISRNVDAGEASCLALCISEKIQFLITDDVDSAYSLGIIAMQKGIKIRICIAVLVELIEKEIITRSNAKEKIEKLVEQRGWEGGVLEVLVKRYIEENETKR